MVDDGDPGEHVGLKDGGGAPRPRPRRGRPDPLTPIVTAWVAGDVSGDGGWPALRSAGKYVVQVVLALDVVVGEAGQRRGKRELASKA